MIELKRPLVAFDIETTGTDQKTARIVEMSIIKIGFTGQILKTSSKFNPGMPIPPEATAVHGITDEMVKDAPLFATKAQQLLAFMSGCDILGYNSNRFDIPVLFEEFARCKLMWDTTDMAFVDAFRIFQIYEKRDLSAAVKRYLGREHDGAHGAEADIQATWEVFNAQLEAHPDLPRDMDALSLLCNGDKKRLDLYGRFALDSQGDYIFTFGKFVNAKCKNELPYLEWMLTADFSMDTKSWVHKIIDSIKNPAK